jgi:hypothetical protein
MSDITQSQEFALLEQSAQVMIQMIGELVIVVQDKLLPASQGLTAIDKFIGIITEQFNKQDAGTKAFMQKYLDFCADARRLIVQVKNTQN